MKLLIFPLLFISTMSFASKKNSRFEHHIQTNCESRFWQAVDRNTEIVDQSYTSVQKKRIITIFRYKQKAAQPQAKL